MLISLKVTQPSVPQSVPVRVLKVAATGLFFALLAILFIARPAWADKPAVRIAVIAEYGMKNSFSAQAIEKGVRLATEEINAAGGVLDGRKLEVITRDDRGVPARAIDHLTEVAAQPDVVAAFSGRMSPVALELVPVANREGILLLGSWGSANGFANNGARPNYAFRLSLNDTLAINAMLRHTLARKLENVVVFLPNTAWGRSNQAEIEKFADQHKQLRPEFVVYNWGDTQFGDKLARARATGAQALIMIANEAEGSRIVEQMAALPATQRLPIISHWGIAGGRFHEMVGPAMDQVDLVVVQTFSFHNAKGERARQVARLYQKTYGEPAEKMLAQVGFAHAYDLTHLLALAINKAGTTQRSAVRDAMETLPPYDGLLRRYKRAFTPDNHEALNSEQVSMARYREDDTLELIK